MDRFWSKVDKTDTCWVWTACTMSMGYGLFWLEGKSVSSHRHSWEMSNGPIGEGLIVRHKCDNRLCVNPDHLETGTYKDNMQDMRDRGREYVPRGTECTGSSLTEAEVLAIRRMCALGDLTYSQIGAIFSLSRQQVSKIYRNIQWKHIK